MGYTLVIGELETVICDEIIHSAKSERHATAPAFGEPTDHTNVRWPSYTSWDESMKFVGLYDLFYNKETGLLREHPGCFPITQEHKKIIDKAHEDFYKKYPKAKAGYDEGNKTWPEENGYACRLEWLKYWFDWALENCTHPVFTNG